jgi:hypothetical protein
MTYETSAAAKPPQTTPRFLGIRIDARVGMGHIAAAAPFRRFPISCVMCPILTVQMCDSPRGTAAVILAIPPLRVDANAYQKGGCLRRICRRRYIVHHYSRVIRADSPLKTAFFILQATQVIGARAGGVEL